MIRVNRFCVRNEFFKNSEVIMRLEVLSKMFAGGYNSVYEQAWNDSLERFIEYCYDNYDIEISDNEIVNRKYQEYLTDCAYQWLKVCTNEKITFENVKIISPAEYNFETDKVEFDMPLTELNLIREIVKKDTKVLERFKQICDGLFKARDCFVPLYKAPDLNETCYLWNKWQLGALFDAYFYDAFEEYQEDCQGYDDAMDILNNNDYYWECTNKKYLDL